MKSFILDGIRYVDPESPDEEPDKPADEFRSTGDATDRAAFIVATIVGIAGGHFLAVKAEQAVRRLLPLLDRLALLPHLPGLLWHTVRYCLSERAESRRGERSG